MRKVDDFLYRHAKVRRAAQVLSRVARPSRTRNEAWVGLECENAAADDFYRLEASGYTVYWDFPGNGFVINHVAVGPNGVFAAGAEGVARPTTGSPSPGRDKVFFDNPVFRSSVRVEPASLARVQRQAEWLSRWLENRTGEIVIVYPMLVVGGWLANRRKWGDIVFVSQSDYQALTTKGAKALSPNAMEKIRSRLDDRINPKSPVPSP